MGSTTRAGLGDRPFGLVKHETRLRATARSHHASCRDLSCTCRSVDNCRPAKSPQSASRVRARRISTSLYDLCTFKSATTASIG